MVRAAFFDLDKTILDTSSNVALSGPFIEAGLMNRRTAIASVFVHLPYLLAGADESRMEQMAEAMGRMGRGWNAAFLEATVEDALERTIQPVCYAQALARIEQHKRAGDVVVIASASVEQVVRPIAQMLGTDVSRARSRTSTRRRARRMPARPWLAHAAGTCRSARRTRIRCRTRRSCASSDIPTRSTRTVPCARWLSARAGPPSRLHPRCASCPARFPLPQRSRCPSSQASPWARRPARWRAARKSPRRACLPARGGRRRAPPGHRRRFPRSSG